MNKELPEWVAAATIWGEPGSWPQSGTWDVAVIGGGLGGVAAALALAQAGRRVVLVEPRTYLGREMTATLRLWLPADQAASLAPAFPLLQAVLEAGVRPAAGAETAPEIALRPGALKQGLEDALLEAGVDLIFASLPLAVTADENGPTGILIGNKGGWQKLACRLLIDTTETALVARLAGAAFADRETSGETVYRRTLEFEGVTAIPGASLAGAAAGAELERTLVLHQGYRGPGHVLVEAAMSFDDGSLSAAAANRRESAAREQSLALAALLVREVPGFGDAELAGAAFELEGPAVPPLRGKPPAWARAAAGRHLLSATSARTLLTLPLAACGGPLPGLWCLNEAVRAAASTRAAQRDPLVALQLGQRLGEVLAGFPVEQPARGPAETAERVLPDTIPVVAEAELLVVGGGTSGATAAIVAGRNDVQTALVEMNAGLGGTGTYGGVHSYWFGRRAGFAAELAEAVAEAHLSLQQQPPSGPVPRWNIEAKATVLLSRARAAGVAMWLNTIFVAPLLEGRRVEGLLAATRWGPVVLRGQVVLDASGDGDVAARAGAPFVYGAARDGATMWYSLAQFARPGRTRNNFTSMVQVGSAADYTRAILAARRRGRKDDHDQGVYLAPRESRHIMGEVVLTLTDQLLQRSWPDVVSIAFSNHDVKGPTDSDWLRVGLLPPNLEVEIPYRALIPEGLDNLLVVGKAFSATHDALPAVRMQADLENLGGVAALAAAQALHEGRALREVDVTALQARLEQAGVLPEGTSGRRLQRWQPGPPQLGHLLEAIDPEQPLHAYSNMEMEDVYHGSIPEVDLCCAGPQVVPLLEEAYGQVAGAQRLRLARLLALVGSAAGQSALVEALQPVLAGPALPERHSHIRYAGAPPDQGAMPEPVYLLNALALAAPAADPEALLAVWQRVVDLLAGATAGDVASGKQGTYYYVEAVCAGAERLASPQAGPLLRQLHSYPPFHGLRQAAGFEDDPYPERRAYLELLIGRALARCGDPAGYETLISYLEDVREPLAAHAYTELVAISGQTLGRDAGSWRAWLEAQQTPLAPCPYRPPTAAQKAWEETILREEGPAPSAG